MLAQALLRLSVIVITPIATRRFGKQLGTTALKAVEFLPV